MKVILRSFINGVLTIVPIILVVYVVFKTFMFLDSIFGNVLKPYLKDDYIPGIGLVATFSLITILGWMSTKFLTGTIIRLLDDCLKIFRL